MNKKEVRKVLKTLDETDKLILSYMKDGLNQKEISEKMYLLQIKPRSLSSIEKRLKLIREKFKARTNFHLAIIISIA